MVKSDVCSAWCHLRHILTRFRLHFIALKTTSNEESRTYVFNVYKTLLRPFNSVHLFEDNNYSCVVCYYVSNTQTT